MALFAGGGWSWGRQVLVIREDFRLWAQGRVWHTVLIVRRILWRRRQGSVGNILRHRLFLRGRRRGGIRRGGIRSRRGIGHLAIFKLKDLSKSMHVCWGCGTGSLRRTYSAFEMKIKASTGAGAAMAGTTGFGVTTLFGFVKHSSSLCSAAAFQAPCKPTGSGVQVEPLLDVADHRRQVFAEEWEPGWVYRHLLSQNSVQQRFQVGPWPLLRLVVVGGDIQHYQCLVVLQGDTALHWDRHLVLYVDWRQSGNASGRELQTVEWRWRRKPLTKIDHIPQVQKLLRLEVQDWRLKIEDSPGALFENLQSRIEDWRLKIPQESCWRIFNPGLKIEDWRFLRTLVGESLILDWRFKIEDSSGLLLENL